MQKCQKKEICQPSRDLESAGEGWKEIALENVRALSIPCASYAKHILQFVTLYGGGEGAPLVNFLDDVA